MRILIALSLWGMLTSVSFALPPGAENWPAECENGNAGSCYFYALQNAQGDQIPKNAQRAVEYGGKACNLGVGEACILVGGIFSKGDQNVQIDQSQAYNFYAAACDLNAHSMNACYYASKAMTESGGDGYEALQIALKGCNGNDYWSCQLLTSAYTFGENGQSVNAANALPFAKRGCDLGHGWACSVAGGAMDGTKAGVEKDLALGIQYLDKGCGLDDGLSCHNAGVWISSGNELGNDMPKAAEYFSKACDIGTYESCYSAGHIKILLDKYDEALPYLSKVCDQENHPAACRMAAMSVAELEGPSASRGLYQKGCDAGDQDSCRYINELNEYERKQGEYNRIYAAQVAEREAGSARVTEALNAGNYNQAMEIATYGIGSRADVSRVVLAANSAGTLSQIDPFYFTFLETWLAMEYPQANQIVRREYLKNPDGISASAVSSRGVASVSNTPAEPSMSDQFFQNQKEEYRRQLDHANRGGDPSSFYLRKN